jgi:hypothetical protein
MRERKKMQKNNETSAATTAGTRARRHTSPGGHRICNIWRVIWKGLQRTTSKSLCRFSSAANSPAARLSARLFAPPKVPKVPKPPKVLKVLKVLKLRL